MKAGILHFILPILASVLSGFLLFLTFPPYDLGWMVWFALIPLFLSFSGKNLKNGFFLPYLCGIIFFAWVFRWTFEIPAYRFLHHAILSIYLGLYFAIFGLSYQAILKRLGITTALVAAPFLWTCLEFMRSNLGFLALPWALLAHSQYKYPLVIQIAAITGAGGVSFLVMLVNSTFSMIIMRYFRKAEGKKSLASNLPSRKASNYMLATTGVMVSLVLTYGYMTISTPLSKEAIKISVLQGNIDREIKANPRKHSRLIMDKYIGLTNQAAQDRPALIVWPEAATPGFVLTDHRILKKIISLIKKTGTYFIVGSSEFPKFAKVHKKQAKSGNTALFFSPEAKILGQYLKIHLVPFGEYIPLESLISWPQIILPKEKQPYEIPGKEFTLFQLGNAKFGVLICWEIVFPDLFRQFVKDGANFMLNITNEGWFGESAAPYQMMGINVFRAVENRISVGRAANTGISCFIDPYGRITGKVRNSNKDIFVEGYLTKIIPLSNERTFYTKHGDIFIYPTVIITFFIMVLSIFRSKNS